MMIIADIQTPTGEPGILIQCDCRAHPRGNRAIVRSGAREICESEPGRIHGLVNAAWHPLSGAASGKRFGPWRA